MNSLWPVLGFIRFLLALVVAGCHLSWFTEKNDAGRLLANFGGLFAVFGFLVLSGYSIAASHERDKDRFYYRRALRILPLYLLVIVACSAAPLLFAKGVVPFPGGSVRPPDFPQFVLNAFFMQGFVAESIEMNPVVWTLGLEVFFYAITPWLAHLSQRTLLVMVCASALLFVNANSHMYVHHPSMLYGINVPLLGWAWLCGFWVFRQKGNAAEVAWAIGMVALTLNNDGMNRWWIYSWTLPFIGIKFAGGWKLPRAVIGAMGFLGDVSYPLYLVHFPAYVLLRAAGYPGKGLLLIPAAFFVAAVLDLAYDKPFKRLMQRTKRATAPVMPPAVLTDVLR